MQIFRFRHAHAREDTRLSPLFHTTSNRKLGKRLDLITWAAVFGVTMNCIIFYSAVEAPCPAYRLVEDSIRIEVYCTDNNKPSLRWFVCKMLTSLSLLNWQTYWCYEQSLHMKHLISCYSTLELTTRLPVYMYIAIATCRLVNEYGQSSSMYTHLYESFQYCFG